MTLFRNLLEDEPLEEDVEEGMVKEDFTISQYSIVLELIVKLYHYITIINLDDPHSSRIVKRLLTIASSEHGWTLLQHLQKYGAFTYDELKYLYHSPKQNVYHHINTLKEIGFIEEDPIVTVQKLDPSKPGKAQSIWAIKGFTEHQIINAQNRHRALIPKKSGVELKDVKQYTPIIRTRLEQLPDHMRSLQHLRTEYPDINPEALRDIANTLNGEGYKIWM